MEAVGPADPPRAAGAVGWLLPVGSLAALAGYWGPWVPHRAAGLVVSGLDLGELVKFTAPVQSGQVSLWREGFYLPLVAVSLVLSLYAFRREGVYPPPVRLLLLVPAAISALNLLPPAWTPATLLAAEFRLQSASLLLCLGLAATSPVLALLPARLARAISLSLLLPAMLVPTIQFWRVLPVLADLYRRPLQPGWGPGLTLLGLLGLAVFSLFSRRELS